MRSPHQHFQVFADFAFLIGRQCLVDLRRALCVCGGLLLVQGRHFLADLIDLRFVAGFHSGRHSGMQVLGFLMQTLGNQIPFSKCGMHLVLLSGGQVELLG